MAPPNYYYEWDGIVVKSIIAAKGAIPQLLGAVGEFCVEQLIDPYGRAGAASWILGCGSAGCL